MLRILSISAAIVLMADHLSARQGAELRSAQPMALALPQTDATRRPSERRALRVEVQAQWRIVSARVHEALDLLAELSFRLRARGFALHDRYVSMAGRMEQSLEQARELIDALEFERAAAALRRADYERTRLKHVTGQ